MAGDVNDAAQTTRTARSASARALQLLASYHTFSAVYVVDRQPGPHLAGRERRRAPVRRSAAPSILKAAARFIVAQPFEAQDLFRAVYRLQAFPERYLRHARFVQPGMLMQLRRTEAR